MPKSGGSHIVSQTGDKSTRLNQVPEMVGEEFGTVLTRIPAKPTIDKARLALPLSIAGT